MKEKIFNFCVENYLLIKTQEKRTQKTIKTYEGDYIFEDVEEIYSFNILFFVVICLLIFFEFWI